MNNLSSHIGRICVAVTEESTDIAKPCDGVEERSYDAKDSACGSDWKERGDQAESDEREA